MKKGNAFQEFENSRYIGVDEPALVSETNEPPVLNEDKTGCDPYLKTPPPPIRDERTVEIVKDNFANYVSLWIMMFVILFLMIFLLWDRYETNNKLEHRGPSDFAEQVRDASASAFDVIFKDLKKIKDWIATHEKAHSHPHSPAINKEFYRKKKTQVIKKKRAPRKTHAEMVAEIKLKERQTELAILREENRHREAVFKNFYESPLRHNEAYRSICFGNNCETLTNRNYSNQVMPLRRRR